MSTIVSGICVPSHRRHPWMQYAATPSTAPMMTIGCSLMSLRLKKLFSVSDVFHLSS